MNKLGICINFWENSWGVDHMKYIKKARDIGFDILEFQAQTLLDMPGEQLDRIRKTAEDVGLELTYSLGLGAEHDVSCMDAGVREKGLNTQRESLRWWAG